MHKISVIAFLLGSLTVSWSALAQVTWPDSSFSTQTKVSTVAETTTYQWEVTKGLYQFSYLTPQQRIARETNGTLWFLDGRYAGNSATLLRCSTSGTITTWRSGQNGMPNIAPKAIASQNGIVWLLVGNGAGQPLKLHRFDGTNWTSVDIATSLFPDFVANGYYFASDMILRADPSGTVWLLYNTNRAIRLNANGTGIAYELTLPASATNWRLNEVEFSPAGVLHLLYDRGSQNTEQVLLARLVNGQFTQLPVRSEATFNSTFNTRRTPSAMAFSATNAVWIGFGSAGASVYVNNGWTHYDTGSFLAGQEVQGITVDGQGVVWFSVKDKGLWKLTPTGQAIEVYNPDLEAGMLWTDATNAKWTFDLNSTATLTKLSENPANPILSLRYTDGGLSRPTTFTTTSTAVYDNRNWYMGDHSLLDRDSYRFEPLPILSNNRTIQYQYQKAGIYRVLLVATNQTNQVETHFSQTITIIDTRSASLLAGWQTLDSLVQRPLDEFIAPGSMALDASGRMGVAFVNGPAGLGLRTSVGSMAWLNGTTWQEVPGITAYNQTAHPTQQLKGILKVIISPTNGALWILEKDSGGMFGRAIFRVLNGQVTRYAMPDVNGIVTGAVFDIAVGPNGTVWAVGNSDDYFGTDNSSAALARFDGTRWLSIIPNNSYNIDDYYAVIVDAANRVWYSEALALHSYDGQTVTEIPHSILGNSGRSFLAIDSQNLKWLANSGTRSIVRFTGSSTTTFTLPEITEPGASGIFPPIGTITSLVIDRNDVLWVGTTKGLASLTGNTWRIYQTTNSGIPANYITGLGVNAQNQLWVGSSNHNDTYNNGYGFMSLFANGSCTVMYSLKAGTWNDPTVWSCNRVPASIDEVEIRHSVSIPGGTANARRIRYTAGGNLRYDQGANLKFGF